MRIGDRPPERLSHQGQLHPTLPARRRVEPARPFATSHRATDHAQPDRPGSQRPRRSPRRTKSSHVFKPPTPKSPSAPAVSWSASARIGPSPTNTAASHNLPSPTSVIRNPPRCPGPNITAERHLGSGNLRATPTSKTPQQSPCTAHKKKQPLNRCMNNAGYRLIFLAHLWTRQRTPTPKSHKRHGCW